MMAVGILTVLAFLGLSSAAVTAVRRRVVQRRRIHQQLELIHAVPVADYRLRAVVG